MCCRFNFFAIYLDLSDSSLTKLLLKPTVIDKISSLISLEIMDATNEESTPEDKNKTFGTSERNLNLIESIKP